MVTCRTTENDSSGSSLLAKRIGSVIALITGVELTDNGDAVTADFDTFKDIDLACLLWCWCTETGKWGCVDDSAETTEFEFGKDFENGDVESVEVVKSKFADCRACDDNLNTGICDFLEDLNDRLSF